VGEAHAKRDSKRARTEKGLQWRLETVLRERQESAKHHKKGDLERNKVEQDQ
jgi:hypothetical protein